MSARLPFALSCMAVLAVALALRYPLLAWHFSHIDDEGVAATILDAKDECRSLAILHSRLEETGRGIDTGNPRLHALHFLAAGSRAKKLESVWSWGYRWVAVPANWTYAPIQYILTVPLVDGHRGYRENLARGRFPSLLAGMLSILLVMFYLARLDKPPSALRASLTAGILMTLSLSHVIFSVHMSSYMAGVLSVPVLLLWLLFRIRCPVLTFRAGLADAFILLVLLYLSYQTFVLVPGFMVGRWMLEEGQWRPTRRKILVFGMMGIVYSIGFLPAYVLRIANTPTILWNAGPNQEFLFQAGGGVGSMAMFFIRNGWLVLATLLSPLEEQNPLFALILTLLVIASACGVIALLQARRDPAVCSLGWVLVITGGLWGLLVLTGRLPFSPTRHQLLLQPFLAILVAKGVIWIHAMIRSRAIRFGFLASGVLIAGWSLVSFHAFATQRIDPVDPVRFHEKMTEHDVDLVITDAAAVKLMPELNVFPVLFIADAGRFQLLNHRSFAGEPRSVAIIRRGIADSGMDPLLAAAEKAAIGTDILFAASRYGITFHEVFSRQVQVELLQRTANGANALEFKILRFMEERE